MFLRRRESGVLLGGLDLVAFSAISVTARLVVRGGEVASLLCRRGGVDVGVEGADFRRAKAIDKKLREDV